MSIRRWDPFSEINTLRDQMNRMMEFFRPGLREPAVPRIDLHQTDDEVIATAEIPGLVSKEDIEVSVTPDSLSVSGEIKRQHAVNEEDYLHAERYYGSFSRVLPLPVEVKPEESHATYENGVLTVRMPKVQPGRDRQPRRIPVQ
ncbi:Hsp20/alpha crystallin family protein [Desulforudis sp. 1088]|uniref:Hsp20/alpha crystallin family protein n=1 Tax=unclassified Candidatus Desulforudis TaxID=2635950 RepID=UPI0034765276